MRLWKRFAWLVTGAAFLALSACSSSSSNNNNNNDDQPSGLNEARVLSTITISGPARVDEGGTAEYIITAGWSDGSASTDTPVWSVNSSDATISEGGILTASAVEMDQEVTITASLIAGGVTKTAAAAVTIVDLPPEYAIPAGLVPTLISTTSVKTGDEIDTDGTWLVWTGRERQGIYISDGQSVTNQTRNLPIEIYPEQFLFDGRYTAFTDLSQKKLYVIDNQDVESTPFMMAVSTQTIRYFDIDRGELVWIDSTDDVLYYVNLDADTRTPVAITDGAMSKIQVKIDDGLIVWSGSNDRWRVFYYDIRATNPIAVQPAGQISYDHWMADVHDRFIVWQGSDSGNDIEIFYCDLRANPLSAVQLTYNTTDDRHPQVHDKIIAWDGHDNSNRSNIVYIDMNEQSPAVTPLTSGLRYDHLEHLRDGMMVWTAYDAGMTSQIVYYDLNAASAGVVQLTSGPDGMNHRLPRISDDRIAWCATGTDTTHIYSRHLPSLSTTEIAVLPYNRILGVSVENGYYLWLPESMSRRMFAQSADGETIQPAAVTPPDVDVVSLDIDNGIAVFAGDDGPASQVYYCDLNSKNPQTLRISYNSTNHREVRIKNKIAVWTGRDINNMDQVFYADLHAAAPSGTAIAVPGDFNQHLHVDAGIITWTGGVYPNYEIYYYDLNASMPQAVNLSNNTIWEVEPRIDQGIIAWNRQNSGNINDVWYYDLFAPVPLETQVTDSAVFNDRLLAVSDRVIVWSSTDGAGRQDLYMIDLDAASAAPVQITSGAYYVGTISVDNGKLVWSAEGELYCYDIHDDNPAPIRITDNDINDYRSEIKDDTIIWKAGYSTYAARW